MSDYLRDFIKTPPNPTGRLNPNLILNSLENSGAAAWDIQRVLGINRTQVPTEVGALVLLFGQYEEDVSADLAGTHMPTSVRGFTADPKKIQQGDGGLYARDRQITRDLHLERLLTEPPLAKAWAWRYELMEDEFYYAAVLRHPLPTSHADMLSEATEAQRSLGGLRGPGVFPEFTFFVPDTLRPDTDVLQISDGHIDLVRRKQIGPETFSYVGAIDVDAMLAEFQAER